MVDGSRAVKTNVVSDSFAETLERIKANNANQCPKCGKIRVEGEKCGCELARVEKIVPQPNVLICDKCGGRRMDWYTRTSNPQEGGTFTYLKDYKYPFAGWADQQYVDIDALYKRTLISFLRYFPFIFILKKRTLTFLAELSEVAWKPLGHPQSKYPPKERFCKSGRELLRVGEKFIDKYFPLTPDDTNPEKFEYTIRFKARGLLWALIMIWEFDNAYRFRGQDLFACINKEELKNHPRKEILRIIKIGMEREMLNDGVFSLGRKWKILYFLANVILFISPKKTKVIQEFLLEANTDEIRPTDADWYFMSERFDYNFGGISYKERIAKKNEEDKEWRANQPKEEPSKPQSQKPALAIFPNALFFELPRDEGQKLIERGFDNFRNEYHKIKDKQESEKAK